MTVFSTCSEKKNLQTFLKFYKYQTGKNICTEEKKQKTKNKVSSEAGRQNFNQNFLFFSGADMFTVYLPKLFCFCADMSQQVTRKNL